MSDNLKYNMGGGGNFGPSSLSSSPLASSSSMYNHYTNNHHYNHYNQSITSPLIGDDQNLVIDCVVRLVLSNRNVKKNLSLNCLFS